MDTVSAQREIAARIERMPITPTQYRARIVVGSATFFDGYDQIMLGLVMPVLAAAWGLKRGQTGMLFSITFVGQFIGALVFPWAAERIGRLRATSWAVAIVGLASLACAAATSFSMLAITRLVQGIGLGGEVPVAATYMNEIAPTRNRGRFFLLYEAAFGVGILGATMVGVLMIPTLGWRAMFVLGGLPLLIAVLMGRLAPESPRWLASRGRYAEADAAVSAMEAEASARAPLPPADPASVPPPVRQETRFAELFSPTYIKRTLMLWVIWAACFFVTTAINTWLPTIYKEQLHLSMQAALTYTLTGYAITLLGSFMVAMLVDKVGRQRWIGWAFVMGSASLIALSIVGATSPYRLLGFAAAAHFCFSSISITIYVYTTELYPTRMRALGTGMGSTMRNIAATISPLVVASVMTDYHLDAVFLMLGLVPLAGALAVWYLNIETSGRALEDIAP